MTENVIDAPLSDAELISIIIPGARRTVTSEKKMKKVTPETDRHRHFCIAHAVKDCAPFLDETFQSILVQTHPARALEVCVYDDGSKDASVDVIRSWLPRFEAAGMRAVFTQRAESAMTRGAAYARNRAIESATGQYLCLLDADDIMLPRRVEAQLAVARARHTTLVGCKFSRLPEDATPRYSAWLNNMSQDELSTHRYRENTLIQPTFFMHRSVFERAGPYEENGRTSWRKKIPCAHSDDVELCEFFLKMFHRAYSYRVLLDSC